MLAGKLRLQHGASLIAIAFAFGATTSAAHADGAAKIEKAKAETQVAQNAPTPPPAPPAPPAADQKVEKVTVTGFRGSLRNALNQKRKSNEQIDSIKAEDIGKFPDLNLS